jgi:hypothetical protein
MLVPELDTKRLEVLKEILPSAQRLLIETGTRSPAVTTARALGVALENVEVSSPADLPGAVASFRAGGVEGVNILSSTLLFYSTKSSARCSWRKSFRRFANGGR